MVSIRLVRFAEDEHSYAGGVVSSCTKITVKSVTLNLFVLGGMVDLIVMDTHLVI